MIIPIMGFFIGIEKFNNEKKREYHLMAIGGASIIHGTFQKLFVSKSIYGFIIIGILIVSGTYLSYYFSKNEITDISKKP